LARLALGLGLVVAWLNFLLTAKWAHLPGALHAARRPFYAAALIAATVLVIWGRRAAGPVGLNLAALRVLCVAAIAVLVGGFFTILPPSTWTLIPFDDDWAPRYQVTVDGVRLLKQGAVAGWQWALLGGHQTSADLSQSLTAVGALPMMLFGDRIGYHLAHLIILAGIPWLVFRDVASDGRRDVALLAAFFTLICTIGMFGTILPSGDTNSIAGVFAALVALTGSRLARAGSRWGGAALVAGLTLAAYTHLGFLMYTGLYLGLEAGFYRDRRMAGRAFAAGVVAGIAALPLYIELLAYPAYFITNNLIYAPGPLPWARVARQIFYNTEILLHPHRWFNDYYSLVKVMLALVGWMAIQPGRSRPRFHAWMVLLAMALLRLDTPEAGFLFTRQMHMLAAFIGAPLAAFIIDHTGNRKLAWALVAIVALYPQTGFDRVPHLDSPREWDPSFAERLSTRAGAMVLVENSPHRDLDSDPSRRTERTPFGVHFESLMAEATGRRLYGQTWDCWHWTPFRGQVVAGGSFRGQAIAYTPIDDFEAEMRKWGVVHLLVWSDATRRYLDAASEHFTRRWSHGRWVEYELRDADPRVVVAQAGGGTLENLHLLGGDIRLEGVRAGDEVVVRMNYFPAWRGHLDGRDVELFQVDGQLAFVAPADGSYVVALEYPRRRALIVLALTALLAGAVGLAYGGRGPGPSDPRRPGAR
jgi:hypothetical protein